ncbi:hypothetical protein [Planctomyces sp. SH-PL14]|uniref:hypothetical protein n=1 Tax=Planctomyces sp. SH-PL14 TaxID=1632864 RepID=UPI0009465E97|nr:hypothetical protein [Planctomyces sp. SH-PL14]
MSDSLNQLRDAVAAERAAIETKRAAVVASLERARSADLASFKPTKFELLPLLQAEYQFRRSLDGFVKDLVAECRAYETTCGEDAQAAEKAIRDRLLDMGYLELVNGAPAMGTYTPDMLIRHPHVRGAKDKRDGVAGEIEGYLSLMRTNQQEVATLTRRLETLRDAAILAV